MLLRRSILVLSVLVMSLSLLSSTQYAGELEVAAAADKGEQDKQAEIEKRAKELRTAIENSDDDVAAGLLIKYPQLVNQIHEGSSPLHRAVRNGDLPLVEYLLRSGADCSVLDSNGQTALHVAATIGNPDVVSAVASGTGASVYAKDKQGKSALDLAPDLQTREALLRARKKFVLEKEDITAHLPTWMHSIVLMSFFGIDLWRILLSLVIIICAIILTTMLKYYIAYLTRKEDRKEGIEHTPEEAQAAAAGEEDLASTKQERSFISLSILACRRGLKLMIWGFALEFIIPILIPNMIEDSDYLGSIVFSIALAVFFFDYANVLEYYLNRYAEKTETKLDDVLVPMFKKGLRILIVVVAGLQLYQTISGNSIATVIAGLGIGSMAIALAATDTLKNLIGFVMILMDKPYTVGERITFEGHDGVIEQIGMRTTRMRRLDGHVVSIPNSKAVDTALHNIGRRPYIKRVMDITVTYDTSVDKIEKAVQIVKDILADHEGMRWDMPPRVYFSELNADSLSILAIYWFHPPDYWAYMDFSQWVNFELMKRFEAEGIEFAFPTQTLYLAGDPARALNMNHPGLEDAIRGMAGGGEIVSGK